MSIAWCAGEAGMIANIYKVDNPFHFLQVPPSCYGSALPLCLFLSGAASALAFLVVQQVQNLLVPMVNWNWMGPHPRDEPSLEARRGGQTLYGFLAGIMFP